MDFKSIGTNVSEILRFYQFKIDSYQCFLEISGFCRFKIDRYQCFS